MNLELSVFFHFNVFRTSILFYLKSHCHANSALVDFLICHEPPRYSLFQGVPHSDGLPFIFSMVWLRAGITTARFSRTALGLPGRFIMSEHFLIPQTAREIMAFGVF